MKALIAYSSKSGNTKKLAEAVNASLTQGGCETTLCAKAHAASLAPSADLVGTFSCQGEVNPAFLEKARLKDPPPPWINDAPKAVGHPDQTDLDRLAAVLKTKLSTVLAWQKGGENG